MAANCGKMAAAAASGCTLAPSTARDVVCLLRCLCCCAGAPHAHGGMPSGRPQRVQRAEPCKVARPLMPFASAPPLPRPVSYHQSSSRSSDRAAAACPPPDEEAAACPPPDEEDAARPPLWRLASARRKREGPGKRAYRLGPSPPPTPTGRRGEPNTRKTTRLPDPFCNYLPRHPSTPLVPPTHLPFWPMKSLKHDHQTHITDPEARALLYRNDYMTTHH